MPDKDYIVSFDFANFIRQSTDLQKSYTDLGSAIQKMSSSMVDDVKTLKEQSELLDKSVGNISVNLDMIASLLDTNMMTFLTSLDQVVNLSESLSKNISSISDSSRKPVLHAESVSETRGDELAVSGGAGIGSDKFVEDLMDLITEIRGESQQALAEVARVNAEIKSLSGKTEEEVKKTMGIMEKELKGAGSAVWGNMKSAMPGIGGGFLASMVGLMILGVAHTDRVERESGEVKNILESSVDGLGGALSDKAEKYISKFQEHAQFKFGISKEETQRVVSTLLGAGYKIEQALGDMNDSVEDTTANVFKLSLALDKHMNIAAGTSASKMNVLVSELGDNLDEAANKFQNLSITAQMSGIGIDKFIGSVMSGSQALSQYGIDMKDVEGVMGKLLRHYEGMGLDKQFSGEQAAQALSGISKGLSGLNEKGISVITQSSVWGDEFEGLSFYGKRQKFKDGIRRVAEGNDNEFFNKGMFATAEWAHKSYSDKGAGVVGIEGLTGMDNRSATAVWDMGLKAMDKHSMTPEEQKEYDRLLAEQKKAFETEGETLSDLQKTQKGLIEALAAMGQGILQTLSSLLATVISGINLLHASQVAMGVSDPKRKKEILDQASASFDASMAGIKTGIDATLEGAKAAGDESYEFAKRVFNPVLQAIESKAKLKPGDARNLVEAGLLKESEREIQNNLKDSLDYERSALGTAFGFLAGKLMGGTLGGILGAGAVEATSNFQPSLLMGALTDFLDNAPGTRGTISESSRKPSEGLKLEGASSLYNSPKKSDGYLMSGEGLKVKSIIPGKFLLQSALTTEASQAN